MIRPVEKGTLVREIRHSVLNLIHEQFETNNLKLPSEQEIADKLNVSRNSLRQVLSQLEAEGVIARKHGQGTFINPMAMTVKVSLQELIDFSDIVKKCGRAPSQEIYSLDWIKADSEISRALRVEEGTSVIRVEYWIYADEIPAIVVAGWCPAEIFPEDIGIEAWQQDSCFRVLYNTAGKLVSSDRVSVKTLTKQQMESRLKHKIPLQCSSALVLDSIGFDQEDQPIIFGTAYFDTTIISFDLFRVNKN